MFIDYQENKIQL